MHCCGTLQRQKVHYEYAMYSGIRASVCPLVVMYMGTPWESTCVTAPPCIYVWRCSHKFTEPNYRSALRVVFPTRLTIVRSLLCWNVHKGNKRTKASFFKPGFVTLKLCWLSNARTCAWVPLAVVVSFHLVSGVVYPIAAYFKFSRWHLKVNMSNVAQLSD